MHIHANRSGQPPETFESMTLMSASSIEGTDTGEWVNGNENDNIINAGGGNDEIYAPLGDNTIDGGDGQDLLLVYGGTRANYSLEAIGDGSYVLRGAGLNGQQTENVIQSVEAVLFDDGLVELDTSAEEAVPDKIVIDDFVEVEPVDVQRFVDQPFSQAAQPTELFAAEPAPAPELEELQELEPEREPVDATESVDFETFGGQARTAQDGNSDFLARVVELTNQVRRQSGLSELTVNSQLQFVAQSHSRAMADQDFFSHTGQDGTQPWDRGVNAGYDYRNYGENIAAGQRTPEEVVQAWVNSPGHLENILNPAFTEIGVGYVYLQDDPGSLNYKSYWAQEFGRPR